MIEVVGLEDIMPPEALAPINKGAMEEVIYNLADAARSEWIRLAQQELFTSRQSYIAGIQPVRLEPGMATIMLVGQLPNLIEQGMGQTDMHDTLLGPSVPVAPVGQRGKRKAKDGGFYRSIPFRHTGPETAGVVGQPMGRPYRGHEAVTDAKKLGRKIFDMAKGLTASRGGQYGGRLTSPVNGPAIAPLLRPYQSKQRPGHKVNIYEGMIRTEDARGRSQFMTFRTISTSPPDTETGKSKPRGYSTWIRPQTQGKFLSKKVGAFITKIAPQAFGDYVKASAGQ